MAALSATRRKQLNYVNCNLETAIVDRTQN
jgi:hypothetical protein